MFYPPIDSPIITMDSLLDQFSVWIESFHKDGYLILPDILDQNICHQLSSDLDIALGNKKKNSKFIVKQMFERSEANLNLFWHEPIVTFAEKLIADNGSLSSVDYNNGIPSANEVHVIHNNSFKIPAKTKGLGGSSWHQDDTPHVVSLDGKPLANIKLSVLCFTVIYYLTDVMSVENGPTQFIQGSHLFGKSCNGDIAGYEDKIVPALGKAGTAVMFNNQTWHRGAPNDSDITRYITQVTYAKRLIGHKYHPFMNYNMPEHIYKNISDPRKSRLLGFLGHGAYG